MPPSSPAPEEAAAPQRPLLNAGAASQKDPGPAEEQALVARLSEAERRNMRQARELARQAQEIDRLRAELAILLKEECSATSAPSGPPAQPSPEWSGWQLGAAPGQASGAEEGEGHEEEARSLARAREQRDQLRSRFLEMTKFLEDYGLSWVGDHVDGDDDDEERDDADEVRPPLPAGGGRDDVTVASCGSAPSSPARQGLTVNVHVMAARVAALNRTVERVGARVVHERKGGAVHARLVADDALPVPMSFFKDGVKLGECEFQEYHLPAAQQLIQDVSDTYFPYVLKDAYPDGVVLQVVDRTELDFAEWRAGPAADDPELTAGGDRLAPRGGRVVRAQGAPSAGSPGKARGPAAKGFERPAGWSGSAGHRGVSAPVRQRAALSEISLLEEGRDAEAPIVRLQLKLHGGERVLFLMEPSQTVGRLEDALEAWHEEHGGSLLPEGIRGHLRSAFPPRAYTDRSQTVADAGLAPSATLFVGAVACDA